MTDVTAMNPYIQSCFAGFAFFQLWIVVWMVRNLIRVMRETNTVISGNTAVIASVKEKMVENQKLTIEIKDRQLSRPCMLPDALKDQIDPIIREYHSRHSDDVEHDACGSILAGKSQKDVLP
jgi:hypothetical protein